MRLEGFLSALNNVAQQGSQYYASCPAHEDKRPSLGVRQGDKGILVTCYAGCSTAQIVDAMGLSLVDLFQEGGGVPRVSFPSPDRIIPDRIIPDSIVSRYQQRLGTGARRYLRHHRIIDSHVISRYRLGLESPRYTIPITEKGRCVDVRRWLRPEKRGEDPKIMSWRTGYGGARLYPEDQLTAPTLILCEGELDALALISCGLPAITLTSGATTWPQKASAALQEHRVYILMDNDEAGLQGAQQRKQTLPGSSIIPWPQRPAGWDVTDEIRAYGVGSIERLIANSRPI